MKALTLFSLWLFIVLILGTSVSAKPLPPVRTLEIDGVYWDWEIPAIDGVAEDSYSEIQTTTIFNPTEWDDENDFTATFRLTWDPSYLYVYVEIIDDVPHIYEWGNGNAYEFDNFEVFIQLDTNTVDTAYDENTAQLRICRGLDSVETPGRAARSDYLYYIESSDDGWIAEVAVPWTAALPEGSHPEDIIDYLDYERPMGFEFHGTDSDDVAWDPCKKDQGSLPDENKRDKEDKDVYCEGIPISQVSWDADDPDTPEDRTEDLAWYNTSVFGYLTYFYESIESYRMENDLQVIPNPASTAIHIDNIDKYCSIRIYNMQGRVLMETGYHPGQKLDISALASGLYMLVINGQRSGRFVKQ